MAPESLVCFVEEDSETRNALKALLAGKGFKVRAYESAQSFLDHHIPGTVGCLVTDVQLTDMSGFELQSKILSEANFLSIIFTSSEHDVLSAVAAMKAGAIDFLLKPLNAETLINSVNLALSRAKEAYSHSETREIIKKLSYLSSREQQVLSYVAFGLPTKRIAREICISPRTIEAHRSSIMKKLGLQTLAQLVRVAIAAGIQPPTQQRMCTTSD